MFKIDKAQLKELVDKHTVKGREDSLAEITLEVRRVLGLSNDKNSEIEKFIFNNLRSDSDYSFREKISKLKPNDERIVKEFKEWRIRRF